MAERSIPIVLVGATAAMGQLVAENMKPEVEVIHFISSVATAKQDLPRLLERQRPSNLSDGGIGSQDYSREPAVIMLGLAYTNEVLDEIREACKGAALAVPWLRGGLSKAEFDDVVASNQLKPAAQQAPITTEKSKKRLLQVLNDGNGGKDGVYDWWKE